jgi:hypothetical protein
MSTQLPIEIVNKILEYKAEINHELIMVQYKQVTNEEYYKINSYSFSLIKVEAAIIMKYLYPLCSSSSLVKYHKQLYDWGKAHYIKRIEETITKNGYNNKINVLCA